jgi:hypothetical protein
MTAPLTMVADMGIQTQNIDNSYRKPGCNLTYHEATFVRAKVMQIGQNGSFKNFKICVIQI